MAGVPDPSTGEEKVLAGVAYLGGCIIFIPTIIILLTKKDSAFVKFHCFQSLSFILFSVVSIVLNIALAILGNIPAVGFIFAMVGGLVLGVLGLAILVYWLILMVKAFQGETMRIPVIADYIESNLMA